MLSTCLENLNTYQRIFPRRTLPLWKNLLNVYAFYDSRSPERPKSALYLRLKERKGFKIVEEGTLWAL